MSSEGADTPGAVPVAGIRSATVNSGFETLDSVHVSTGNHLNETMVPASTAPHSGLELSGPGTSIVAQLVPDEDEIADRVKQQVEKELRQITVNAVSVDEAGFDPAFSDRNSTKIMGLSKPIFICLMTVLVLITASVIAVAVLLPGDGTTDAIMVTQAPKSNGVDELVSLIGDYIDKDGGSTITDPTTTQYQALDWLANVDEWNALKQAADGVPIQVLVERYALVMLYLISTNGAGKWYNSFSFLSPTSVCDWFDPITGKGVICDGDHQFVSGLNLNESGIKGQIPSELFLLTSLSHLDVSGNQIVGSLPTEIGLLTELITFDVKYNDMVGPIPRELGECTSLNELNLSSNQFTREIPITLSRLTALTALDFSHNSLLSYIPTEIGALTKLSHFLVYSNQISGSIPTELGQGTSLVALDMSGNELTGNIPSELGRLTNLIYLWFDGNSLTGKIPTEIGNLAELSLCGISSNRMSGSIPTELGQCTSLEGLYISINDLTGPIPSELGLMTNLVYLFMNENSLSGTVSTEIGKLTELSELYIDKNRMSGSIPTELGLLTQLSIVGLHLNGVDGSLDTIFCDGRVFDSLSSDCLEENSNITCTCCTECCNATTCCYDSNECYSV